MEGVATDRHHLRAKRAQIPQSPGVYVIREGDEVLYVGMSGSNLRTRIGAHAQGNWHISLLAKRMMIDILRERADHEMTLSALATYSVGAQLVRDHIEASDITVEWTVAGSAEEAKELEADTRDRLDPAHCLLR